MSYTIQNRNLPDGSVVYILKCDLMSHYDENAQVVENPLVFLEWSEEEQQHVVVETKETPIHNNDDDDDDDFLIPDVNFDAISLDNLPSNATKEQISSDLVMARECWCARLFQAQPSERNPKPNPPVYCPVDTSGDSLPNGKGDPNVCRVQALVSPEGIIQTDGYLAECYAEDRMAEFSRSVWPLCFFWLAMLVYVWFATNYGKRCRGYLWRITALGCSRMRKWKNNNNDDDERQAIQRESRPHQEETSLEEGQRSPPSVENNNPTAQDEEPEDPMEVILREFGSYDNFRLLDYDLRYHAERTNNEYISWLWYSAVHNEEIRFRRERKRRRRERRRARLREREQREDETSDASSVDSEENEPQAMRDIMVTRRLDPVFWWPPSGPDGRRWQHLVDRNNTRRGTDENEDDTDGVTIDPNRLFLKTKRFSMEEVLSDSCRDVPNEEEIPENLCSICLCEIEDGEIVGDLPCKHYFHKECLKDWLIKSNLCPFCRLSNIASHKTRRQLPSEDNTLDHPPTTNNSSEGGASLTSPADGTSDEENDVPTTNGSR